MEKELRSLRVLRHGGREALRIVTTLPAGESRMARHVRELAARLSNFAERELLPAICSELEQAVEKGCGYRFFSHRYEVFFKERAMLRGIFITLFARHTVGERVITEHALPMYWTRGGAWQLQKKHRIPYG